MYPLSFEVGEIAVCISVPFEEQECEVTKPLHWQENIFDQWRRKFASGMMYEVQFPAEPYPLYAFPHELRKRKPPQAVQTVNTEAEAFA